MEYCEQGDLGKHISGAIRRGNVKFDAERIYTWWYQILDAIDFCHSKGVLHRDLKPKNIFIDAKLNVKVRISSARLHTVQELKADECNVMQQVGDFGVSALISSPPALERIGTVTYHAPEVKSSLKYSAKSDVWAIGVIMLETLQLRPGAAEPMNISMINFSTIVPVYGQPARELLLMHLTDHPDQRPNAGALKESLMQLLQEPTRQTVASRAYSSSARSVTDAARQLDWMRPRTVPVPDTLKDNTSDLQPVMYEQDQRSDSGSSRYQWDSASEPSVQSARDGGSVSSTDRSHATTVNSGSRSNNVASAQAEPIQEPAKPSESAEVLELSEELGIYVSSGTDGEFGAWKIAKLPEEKPAAKSKAIAIGEYLWEINGKIIFGMPFQLISSLIKGKSPEVKLGVKAGLALSIRNAVIRRDGNYNSPGDGDAVPNSGEPSDSDVPAAAPVTNTVENSRNTSPESHSSPKDDSLPQTESPLLNAQENSCTIVAILPSPQTTGAVESDNRMAEPVSEVEAPQRMDKVVQLAQRSAPPPVLTPAPAAAPNITEANAPAMAFEPQGIRGMSSPTMQSPLSTPHVAAPAHIPSSFPRDSVESKPEGKTEGKKDAAASPSTENRIKPTARGSATIAGEGQYSGELFEGKPFGMGTATWPHQGHTYVGEWRNGVMHGHGTATYLNGDRYDGEWANGKRSGLGRYAHGSGDIYEGLWSNERKHGLGVDSFDDGRGYRGEFMENKFAGVGAYFTVDGAVYQVRSSP